MASAEAAEAVVAQVPREWQGWVTRGLNRSPLAARLQLERQERRGVEAGR
jgi:NADH:ubiquinone oxidoreductase subunit